MSKFDLDYKKLTMATIIPIFVRGLAGYVNNQPMNIVLQEAIALTFICVSIIYLIPFGEYAYHKYFDGNPTTWVVE